MGFKDFYLKEASLIKIDNFIFQEEPMLPLSTKMLDRIFGKKKKIGFHSTDPFKIKNLEKLQNTKKSISTFTEIGSVSELENIMTTGVATDGGVIVELEGNVLLHAPVDIFSSVDKQGRRWIPVTSIGHLELAYQLKEKIDKIKNDLFKKYKVIDWTINEPNKYSTVKTVDYESGESINKQDKAKLIKEYFDSIEKILKGKMIKQLFEFLTKASGQASYNEVIMNNIKIKKLYVISFQEDRLRDKIGKKYPIEVITIKDYTNLKNYINKVGKS